MFKPTMIVNPIKHDANSIPFCKLPSKDDAAPMISGPTIEPKSVQNATVESAADVFSDECPLLLKATGTNGAQPTPKKK